MAIESKIRRGGRSLARVLRTRYPAFAFGLPAKRGEIPVFVYHDVSREQLAGDLRFLQRNGYQTLSLHDLRKYAAGASPVKGVVLSFDDARRSFIQTVLPLLEEYHARAALFVPTYWVEKASEGGTGRGEELFMTWSEVRHCLDSGRVDVEAHGHRHALVYSSDRLVGFVTPASLRRFDLFDWPLRHAGGADELGYPPLGTPIYEAMPLLSASHRLRENETAARTCQEMVQAEGRERFFARKGWEKRLLAAHRQAYPKASGSERVTGLAFERLLRSEFEHSLGLFQQRLGRSPEFLAYPWMLGSRRSMELAQGFGIKAVFGVGLDFRRIKSGSLPVAAYGRFKADWLRFLPGEARRFLPTALGERFSAIGRINHFAH